MVEEALQRAQLALTQGRWSDARNEFESILQVEQRPDAMQGLSEALWWLGDASGCLRASERAYAMFREAGFVLESAFACIWLSMLQLKSRGNQAACSGWIATAERLMDGGRHRGNARLGAMGALERGNRSERRAGVGRASPGHGARVRRPGPGAVRS